jgi:hypothetical protein
MLPVTRLYILITADDDLQLFGIECRFELITDLDIG